MGNVPVYPSTVLGFKNACGKILMGKQTIEFTTGILRNQSCDGSRSLAEQKKENIVFFGKNVLWCSTGIPRVNEEKDICLISPCWERPVCSPWPNATHTQASFMHETKGQRHYVTRLFSSGSSIENFLREWRSTFIAREPKLFPFRFAEPETTRGKRGWGRPSAHSSGQKGALHQNASGSTYFKGKVRGIPLAQAIWAVSHHSRAAFVSCFVSWNKRKTLVIIK